MTASIIILLITLIVSFFGLRSDLVKYLLCLWSNKFYQIWRPFTYSFVHNSSSHLFSNTFFYCIGFLGLFQKLSNFEFLTFYFLSAIISIVPEFLFKSKNEFTTVSGNSAIGFSIFFGTVAMDPNKLWGLFGYGLPAYYFGIGYFILSLIEAKFNKKISLSPHILGAIFGITYVLYF
jgi:membrane associated rhomboid family serine protease